MAADTTLTAFASPGGRLDFRSPPSTRLLRANGWRAARRFSELSLETEKEAKPPSSGAVFIIVPFDPQPAQLVRVKRFQPLYWISVD